MGDRHFYKCPNCGEWITNAFDERLQEVGQIRCHSCSRLFQLKTTLTEMPVKRKPIYHSPCLIVASSSPPGKANNVPDWPGPVSFRAKYTMNDRKVNIEENCELNLPGYQVFVGSEAFYVAIEPDEDGYIVDCPSLPGCYTQGDTIDEAITNIKELIQLHLDVRATTPYVPMKTLVVTVDFTITVPNWVDPEEVFTMFDHGILRFAAGKGKHTPSLEGVFYKDIASADDVLCHETTGVRREIPEHPDDFSILGRVGIKDPENDGFQCENCGNIFDIDDSRAIEGELFCVECFKKEKGD